MPKHNKLDILSPENLIDSIFYHNGIGKISCEECQYFQEWFEPQPFGATFATETHTECTVLSKGDVADCPAMLQYLTGLKEELEQLMENCK